MREPLEPLPSNDNPLEVLTQEQRTLRKQRARIESDITDITRQRELLTKELQEKMPLIERLRTLGARAWLGTQLSKLELDLRILAEREASDANRYTYIAPVEIPDLDESND